MVKPKLFGLLLLFAGTASFAQTKYTVSGTVRDGATGEVLIGATVVLQGGKAGVVTNGYGFFSVTAPAGQYLLVVSFAGFVPDSFRIGLDRQLTQDVRLGADSSALQAVVVSSVRKDANVTQPLMGVQKLTMAEIANVPVLFGEKDVLKTLQLLPGVQSTGDGSSGFAVQGRDRRARPDPAR